MSKPKKGDVKYLYRRTKLTYDGEAWLGSVSEPLPAGARVLTKEQALHRLYGRIPDDYIGAALDELFCAKE